jgi:hypothetical protein
MGPQQSNLNGFSPSFKAAVQNFEASIKKVHDFTDTVKSSNSISLKDEDTYSQLVDEINRMVSAMYASATTPAESQQANALFTSNDAVVREFSVYSKVAWNRKIEEQQKSLNEQRAKLETTSKEVETERQQLEASYGNFIAIGSLLVALVALIFGNVSQLLANIVDLKNILVINLSMLLSISLIFFFVQLIISRSLKTDLHEKGKINRDIFILGGFVVVVLAILVLLLCVLFFYPSSSGQAASISSLPENSSSFSSQASS